MIEGRAESGKNGREKGDVGKGHEFSRIGGERYGNWLCFGDSRELVVRVGLEWGPLVERQNERGATGVCGENGGR